MRSLTFGRPAPVGSLDLRFGCRPAEGCRLVHRARLELDECQVMPWIADHVAGLAGMPGDLRTLDPIAIAWRFHAAIIVG